MFSLEFVIERPEKYGGAIDFTTYESLEEAYVKEEVYPADLKNGVAAHLVKVRLRLFRKIMSNIYVLFLRVLAHTAHGTSPESLCLRPRVPKDQTLGLPRPIE